MRAKQQSEDAIAPLTFNPSFDLSTLKVAALLKAHEALKAKSHLPAVLGDGYLNDKVLVHRNLRAVFLKFGGRFVDADHPLSAKFHKTLPLAALDEILTTWEVPYSENVLALESFEAVNPGVFPVGPVVSQAIGIKRNFLLHETSHCLLDRVIPSELRSTRLPHERAVVLRMLMGEAFANTTGALCAADISSKLDLAFYTVNDYGYCLAPRRGDLIREAVKRLGYQHSFKLLFLAFISLKYLATEVSKAALGRLLSAFVPDLKVSRADMVWVHTLVNSLFIGHEFLIELNSFYFSFIGIKHSLGQLLDFDFVGAITRSPELSAGLGVLGDICEHGVKAKGLEVLARPQKKTQRENVKAQLG